MHQLTHTIHYRSRSGEAIALARRLHSSEGSRVYIDVSGREVHTCPILGARAFDPASVSPMPGGGGPNQSLGSQRVPRPPTCPAPASSHVQCSRWY